MPLSVGAANKIYDIDIDVNLDKDGTAYITEIWDVDGNDGILSLRPHPFDPYKFYVIGFKNENFQINGVYECDISESFIDSNNYFI